MRGIPDTRFLEADWSIQCDVGEHASMMILGVAGQLLYIVGIPVSMFVILFRNRRALHNPSHPKHEACVYELGGLYQQYEPSYWWFECLILAHKMILTGALCIIGEDSSMQPLAATLFQLVYLLTVLKLSPVSMPD